MDAIDTLLTRGIDTIYPSKDALEKLLRSGKKVRVYQGFDPSGITLHIGHAVAMRKLAQFQKLGATVIFLIGDFTGRIGDPTGKNAERKPLSEEEVKRNAKDYVRQASKILDFEGDNPVQIMYNSQWLAKLTFADIIGLLSHFTVQQMIERDMFQNRLKSNIPIHLHEFLYPAMQGYDSVMMDVDIELGGTDQTFNMLAGRTLMKELKNKEKFVMTVPLLTDNSGKKIGKTEGNAIGISDDPIQFYGKIMSLPDSAIIPCFTLLTDTEDREIEIMKDTLEKGSNPMDLKKRLAFELTKQFNSQSDATKAQTAFEATFQTKQSLGQSAVPITLATKEYSPLELVCATDQTLSKSEVRRLIAAGAVDLDGNILTPEQKTCTIREGSILKVGKKQFYRIERTK